jgi:regulator of replication initiation timing
LSKLISERDTWKAKVVAFESQSNAGVAAGPVAGAGAGVGVGAGLPLSGQSVKDLDHIRKQLSIATAENDVLKQDVLELKRKLQQANTQAALNLSSTTGGVGGGPADSQQVLQGTYQLQQELKKLQDENSKLKQELSAFDLEFFEEIENLKFAHAQAVRKIKMYEQEIQQLQGGGGGGGQGVRSRH